MPVILWRFEYRRRPNSNDRIGYNNRDYYVRNNDIFLAGGAALVYLAFMLCKEKILLVARIVSFDTVGLYLLTFRIF